MTRAAERERPDVRAARQAWAAGVLPDADPNRVVIVGETAAGTQLGRRYGCAPRGGPAVGRVPHGHSKRLAFTAALRADGLVAAQVLDGPTTGDRLVAYVERVRAPALRAGDTVAMDNLPCRKRAGVRAAIEPAGCTLRLPPPYSPECNPIEMAFVKLERVLRTGGHRAVPLLGVGLRAAGTPFRPTGCANYI